MKSVRKCHFLSFFCCFFLALLISCSKQTAPDLRIGIDPSWYPLELAGRQTNVVAFTGELLQAIAKENGLRIAVIPANFDDLFQRLDEKKYDAVISSLEPHIFYQDRYVFSQPYLLTGPVIVTLKDRSPLVLDSQELKEIAILRGSKAEELLQKYPHIILRIYDSIPDALNASENLIVDGVAIDLLQAQAYTRDLYQGTLKIATPPLDQTGLRLVTAKENSPSTIKLFNEGLEKLKSNGHYELMLKKWGLSDDPKFKVEMDRHYLDQLRHFLIF